MRLKALEFVLAKTGSPSQCKAVDQRMIKVIHAGTPPLGEIYRSREKILPLARGTQITTAIPTSRSI